MYLEWPLYRWFRLVFLEVGASLALFYALAYVVRVLGSKRRQSGLFLSKDSNALWRF